MIEIIVSAGLVVAITLMCVYLALMVYGAYLNHKCDKRLDEVADLYLAMTRLRYEAALNELVKEGGEDER